MIFRATQSVELFCAYIVTKTPQNRSPEESKNLLKLYVLKRMINVWRTVVLYEQL